MGHHDDNWNIEHDHDDPVDRRAEDVLDRVVTHRRCPVDIGIRMMRRKETSYQARPYVPWPLADYRTAVRPSVAGHRAGVARDTTFAGIPDRSSARRSIWVQFGSDVAGALGRDGKSLTLYQLRSSLPELPG